MTGRQWWWWWWWSLCTLVAAVVPEGENVGPVLHDAGRAPTGHRCPESCSCLLPEEVVCLATGGEQYPPRPPNDITKLVLRGYEFVPTHFLANLKSLRHLEVSGSQINSLAFLPLLPELEVLLVTHNRLRFLGDGHLGKNTPALTHLDASHNDLMLLNRNDLEGLHHLQVLNLHSNSISEASTEALKDLTSLTHLDISKSKLPKLHSHWLANAQKLQYLNVSNANVSDIPRIQGENIKVLDVSHNFLTVLPDGLIMATCLQSLFLHHNPLQTVNERTFQGAKCLLQLYLSHTPVVNIDEFIFSEMPQLLELHLEHNEDLLRIEHGAFTGLHKLQHLNLAETPNLKEIEEVAFAGLPDLISLDLRKSGLTVLPLSLTNLVKHNTSVFLAGTQLRCDCYHSWLPNLLTTTDISSWNGVEPLACSDGQFRSAARLAAHINALGCEKPTAVTHSGDRVVANSRQSALLECNITAHPPHTILWLSKEQKVFRYNGTSNNHDEWISHHIQQIEGSASQDPRFEVLASGHLLVRDVIHSDVGWYKCFAYNSVGNTSLLVFLALSDAPLRTLYNESLLFGFACATLFLLITLFIQLLNYLMDRLGWACCCCCKDRLSPKARQIRKLLESVEAYKSQQLDRLRENYNYQVVSIKDSCYQQMERIRESYSAQGKNLRDLRDYSTQGLTSMRDQYLDQVNKVRDYSVSQMNRVRENYVFQRHRIRKFSAHQLLRLRETYKYQQKTLNKILENLPDLYLQNCRTGACQRTDSIIFDDTLHGLDAYYKVDFFDTQSHHSSDYYTPASTLTHSFRSSKGQEHIKQHSRTSSNTSSDFVEAQAWIRRDSSALSGNSPSRTIPSYAKIHNRSLSVAGASFNVSDPIKVHKRSQSASHPYHRVAPAPETRGIPARITLCEETSDCNPTSINSPASVPSTPVHKKGESNSPTNSLKAQKVQNPDNPEQASQKGEAAGKSADTNPSSSCDSNDSSACEDDVNSVPSDVSVQPSVVDRGVAFETSL